MVLIFLTIAAILPSEDVTRERCDLIVLNSFYDDQARLVFDQLLFYDWSHDDGRFQLRAWRMVKSTAQHPRYDHARELWTTTTWLDGEIPRQITAPVYQHVFTSFDPELTEREFLPKEQRRELRQPFSALRK